MAFQDYFTHFELRYGVIALSVAMSLGMQVVPILIPASGTIFIKNLVMKIFLQTLPIQLIQLMVKECMLNTA